MSDNGSTMAPPFPIDASFPPLSSQHTSQREENLGQIGPAHSLDSNSCGLTLPTVYHDKFGKLQEINFEEDESRTNYLHWELDFSRLDGMHRHLWLAGRSSVGARALHRQVLVGRVIIISEQADLHLVWQDSRIYLKPMPEFLLNFKFWDKHLCKDEVLWKNARGFLLSYLWLVTSKGDLGIAHDKGLLPREMNWERWVFFSRSLLRSIDIEALDSVNRRFLYGELRLNRLNWIYRIFSLKDNRKGFIRGYKYDYNRYSVFVQRNFAWIIAAFVYITIVLTAMQVGLATDRLRNDERFQNASYGFTVFAILAPIAALGVLAVLLIVLVFFNFREALKLKKKKPHRTPTYPRKGTV